MSTRVWIVFSVIACLCAASARAGNDYRKEMEGVDARVQAVKSDVLNIDTQLKQLEEKLLYPSNTELAVFVRLAGGNKFNLYAVKIQIDGKRAADYIYSYRELEALRKGGVQRIYMGNVATGAHEIQVSMSSKLAGGKDYTKTESFSFTKGVRPKLIGVTLAGPGAGGASIHIGNW